MINRKFINFKTYNAFKAKLNDNEIPEDSIVFIQDKLCIWAHGKEYICNGPYTAEKDGQSLKFKNGNDTVVLTLSLDGNTITFTDSNGQTIFSEFALKSELAPIMNEITRVYNELDQKIDNTKRNIDIDIANIQRGFETDLTGINNILETKQDKLTAGYGIDITQNVISSKLDGSLFIIVTELPDVADANPNKIYILEQKIGDQYTHEQWRVIDGEWVLIDLTVAQIDYDSYFDQKLGDYALLSYVDSKFSLLNSYAPLSYVNDNFVRKSEVYHPDQEGGWGSGTNTGSQQEIIIAPSVSQIDVDSVLSLSSSNPVENRIITRALQNKIEQSELNQYAKKTELQNKADKSQLDLKADKTDLLTKADKSDLENIPAVADLEAGLATKQDKLHAGDGIYIDENTNTISSTLDTNLWVVVDELPTENINENKIYLVQEEQNGDYIYVEYRYVNGDWIPSGQRIPEVDLSAYLTSANAASTYLSKTDASSTYLASTLAASTYLSKADAAIMYQQAGNYAPAGNYALVEDLDDYQPVGDYIDYDTFEAFRLNINTTFQRRGGYALASDVSTALTTLQQIIDQKYVLKKDVYNPASNEWSSSDPAQITLAAPNGGGESTGEGGGATGASNMVTLTVEQYEALVRANLVDPNTYYFTYEDDIWTFGGTFPIKLT